MHNFPILSYYICYGRPNHTVQITKCQTTRNESQQRIGSIRIKWIKYWTDSWFIESYCKHVIQSSIHWIRRRKSTWIDLILNRLSFVWYDTRLFGYLIVKKLLSKVLLSVHICANIRSRYAFFVGWLANKKSSIF